MPGGGSIGLKIDNVYDRAWWEDVALGEKHGVRKFDAHDRAVQMPCWFWVSETRTKIYSRVSRGDTPRNGLFWHLRNEDWKARELYARLRSNGRCDSASCVNPWHWDYTTTSAKSGDVGASMLDVIRDHIRNGTDYTNNKQDMRLALNWYILLLEGEKIGRRCTVKDSFTGRPSEGIEMVTMKSLFDQDGAPEVDVRSATYLNSTEDFVKHPIAVAMFERMAADKIDDPDGALKLDEAIRKRGEILRGMMNERRERIEARDAAWDAERKPAPTPAEGEEEGEEREPWDISDEEWARLVEESRPIREGNAAKSKIKPRPRVRPKSAQT